MEYLIEILECLTHEVSQNIIVGTIYHNQFAAYHNQLYVHFLPLDDQHHHNLSPRRQPWLHSDVDRPADRRVAGGGRAAGQFNAREGYAGSPDCAQGPDGQAVWLYL